LRRCFRLHRPAWEPVGSVYGTHQFASWCGLDAALHKQSCSKNRYSQHSFSWSQKDYMEGSHRPCVVSESWTIGVAKLLGLVDTDYVTWLLVTLLFWGSRIECFCHLHKNFNTSTGNNETAFVFGQVEPFVGGIGLGRRSLRRPPTWLRLLPHHPAGGKDRVLSISVKTPN